MEKATTLQEWAEDAVRRNLLQLKVGESKENTYIGYPAGLPPGVYWIKAQDRKGGRSYIQRDWTAPGSFRG